MVRRRNGDLLNQVRQVRTRGPAIYQCSPFAPILNAGHVSLAELLSDHWQAHGVLSGVRQSFAIAGRHGPCLLCPSAFVARWLHGRHLRPFAGSVKAYIALVRGVPDIAFFLFFVIALDQMFEWLRHKVLCPDWDQPIRQGNDFVVCAAGKVALRQCGAMDA